MKILAIGDVVGEISITHLEKKLWPLRDHLGADFVVCNGENTSEIHGLNARHAAALLDTGIDLLTLGNHAFGARDLGPFLDDNPDKIIRPANYPAVCPGSLLHSEPQILCALVNLTLRTLPLGALSLGCETDL